MRNDLSSLAQWHRARTVEMIHLAQSGHAGGALSCAEILVTIYYEVLRTGVDRCILSKGHACAMLYSVLAGRGHFPDAWLPTFRQFGSHLQGHPDMKKTPGVDFSSGSLAQGLSAGAGLALAERLKGSEGRVYVVIGDGEMDEGQVWEAALLAGRYRLDNLVVILDRNHLQLDGPTEEILPLESPAAKWEALGFATVTVDGHDPAGLLAAFGRVPEQPGRPTAIVAETVKGKGVSYMENVVDWHSNVISRVLRDQALWELGFDPATFCLDGEVRS